LRRNDQGLTSEKYFTLFLLAELVATLKEYDPDTCRGWLFLVE